MDTINRQDAIDELHGKDPSQIWDTADIEVWLNSLPSAQPDVPDTNVGDCISRQALCEYALNQKDKSVTPNDIMRFPSAQPEQNNTSNTLKSLDCVDRQAAIDAMSNALIRVFPEHENIAKKTIGALPSAQPTQNNAPNALESLDSISRQAAIDIVEFECGEWRGLARTIVKAIEQLHSAQPATARRIVGKSRDGMTLWYQCEICNEPIDEQDTFCSGCGRRLING